MTASRPLPVLPNTLAWAGAASPCRANACRQCCFDTQMPLLPSDVERLAKVTGRDPATFSRPDDAGAGRRLSNVNGQCVFLGAEGCTVYEDRPAGCRLYPLVYDPDERQGVLDPECPYRGGFRVRPRDRAALADLVAALGPS